MKRTLTHFILKITANRLLAESLTDEILAQLYYKKWDGKLPYFYGSEEGTLIQVPMP